MIHARLSAGKSHKSGFGGMGDYFIGLPAVVNVQTFLTKFSTDIYVTSKIPNVMPKPVLELPGRQRKTVGCALHTFINNKWCAMHTLPVTIFSTDIYVTGPSAPLRVKVVFMPSGDEALHSSWDSLRRTPYGGAVPGTPYGETRHKSAIENSYWLLRTYLPMFRIACRRRCSFSTRAMRI